jgi:hypothetical protein
LGKARRVSGRPCSGAKRSANPIRSSKMTLGTCYFFEEILSGATVPIARFRR